VYDLLRKVGALLYPQPDHATVHRLPFGLYLKRQTDSARSRNELAALQLLHRYTTIPVPKPLDLVHKPAKPANPAAADPFSVAEAETYGETYLVTTRVPGLPLYRCQHVLSDADLADLAAQLAAHLAQLRAVPRQCNNTNINTHQKIKIKICDARGEAVRDPRIRGGEPVGPFPDEAAFSRELMFSDDAARRGHRVVFTHADLNPRNILVERRGEGQGTLGGRWVVAGIVDWENAGFYPEYWDCTKAFFEGFRWSTRYNDMVKKVFASLGDYERELEVERRSWKLGDAI
jgi:aminoglycoside phosphotransferase (APT) family kinase protein